MARQQEAAAVYRVADLFRDRCLVAGTSLLRPSHPSWTPGNIDALWAAFMGHPDMGKDSFLDKWRKQLADESPDVHRVAADALAFYYLFPAQIGLNAKISAVRRVMAWNLSDEGDLPDLAVLEEAFARGIGNSGPYYSTGQPQQVAFYLQFARRVLTDGIDPHDADACKHVADDIVAKVAGSASARHVLLHLLFPDRFERTASTDHKRRIVAAFKDETGGAEDIDDALLAIRQTLSARLDLPRFDFYDDPDLHQRWEPGSSPNVNAVRAAVEGLYQDPEVRHACLTQLVDSIERAHAVSPASWGVTLREDQDNNVRLNISRAQACLLGTAGLYLVLDQDALDAPLRQRVDAEMADGHDIGAVYRSLPFAYGAQLPAPRVNELLPLVREAHLTFVERSARLVRTRLSYYQAHTPGVIAYLREVLDRDVPDPDYGLLGAGPTLPPAPEPFPSPSTLDDLATATHLDRADLAELDELLRDKQQIVLEGPPGSGKTYVADLFARWFVGASLAGEDDERVETVQFHQSYGYEDFVQGIRPVTDEQGQLRYRVVPGIFARLCDLAARNPGRRFVLLIDEINRGNLSRIFGELLLLLEYRDKRVRLPYGSGEEGGAGAYLTIPRNLYLIGTMNSTDRSLALIDYALRRRFYFYRLLPVADGRAPVLERWLAKQALEPDDRQRVLRLFLELNGRIERQLSAEFQVGHSYFMRGDIGTPAGLDRVWRRALRPLLEEYLHGLRDREALLAELAPDRLVAATDAPTADGA